MNWFKTYMEYKKFKNVVSLGVFDARDLTGWFIDNNTQYEKIYLIDNYAFEGTRYTEDPNKLIQIINRKIQGKENIDFIIEDGNLIDYTKFDFDFALIDCDNDDATEKIMNDNPDVVFCMTAFFNSFYRTNQIFEWMKDKKIYPFLYLNSETSIFFTLNKKKHAICYEEASNIDFGSFIKYEKFIGCRIVCPRTSRPFYEHQQEKL